MFDTTASEAPGATADFKVMMLPEPVTRASVDYATSDGTATAGMDYTATSGTLIFEVGEVHKRISVPVIDDSDEDSGETFKLTLSNPINAFVGDATATATIYNHDPEDLTASFGGAPETHGGEPFVLLLQFTEPVGVGWETMSDRLLNVTNGRVAQARRVDRERDRVTNKVRSALWEITIEPSLGDVTVELPATADCEAPLAVCTKDGRPLSAGASVTVALAALTATQGAYPSVHDRAELDLELAFSAPVTLTPEAMRDHALAVTNAELVSVSRAAEDEKRWRFRLLPLSNETVTVTLPTPTDCAVQGAVCTADGRALTTALTWQIAPRDPGAVDATGPALVSAELERATLVLLYDEGLDEASVPASGAFTVTVAGAVRSLAASAPVTVTGRRALLALASTVAPGDEVTVSYAAPPENRLQDRADNAAPALSDLAVTNATRPFTVRFEEGSVPETHDGVNRVAFRLAFSEDPAKLQGRWVSKLLREAVVARIGDDRIYTRDIERLHDTSRRRWQMKVRFLGGFALATEDLTIELGPTSDCADADALCTKDGWKLSNRISARIRYAPSVSVAGANAAEASGATVDFPVTLSRALARRVTVDYATSDGTARAGEDYAGVSGTLTFAPGETQKTISVPVLDDADNEEAETLTLTLSNASGAGAVIRVASAAGTIEDDEPGREPTRVAGASVTSGPGENGAWDTDETVVVEVRFSRPVGVNGPPDVKPTIGITLDGRRRAAAYVGGKRHAGAALRTPRNRGGRRRREGAGGGGQPRPQRVHLRRQRGTRGGARLLRRSVRDGGRARAGRLGRRALDPGRDGRGAPHLQRGGDRGGRDADAAGRHRGRGGGARLRVGIGERGARVLRSRPERRDRDHRARRRGEQPRAQRGPDRRAGVGARRRARPRWDRSHGGARRRRGVRPADGGVSRRAPTPTAETPSPSSFASARRSP